MFFTHPYGSTERARPSALDRDLNGLVRHYMPKRTSFAALTQERLDEIASLLNDRPRELLGH